MTPCVFQASVLLDAPVEDVFAFHSDPRNIASIAPSWQHVEVRRGEPVAREGDHFEIAVCLAGLFLLRWQGRWAEVQPPQLLVDDGLRAGPFSFWHHRHQFRAVDEARTEMTDHVIYALPGGWLGKLAGETLGRWQMRLMFADRHRRTQAHFRA